MKICFIAPAGNYHIVKWANWFSARGHEVHVISFIDAELPAVNVHFVDAGVSSKDPDLKKLKYLFHARKLRHIVEEIRPDVVNVHYATSYGAAAALSGLKGYVLSVWGSDIYDFPLKSPLHKALVKFSLARAGYIFSTSSAMAAETKKYTDKHIDITPFGVDMELFNPAKRDAPDGAFIVGTVKALHPKYGIDHLLRAVAEVVKNRPDIPIKARIAGKGPMEKEYRQLASDLGISDRVTWLGFISQLEAAREWANMDAAVLPSGRESFGVSAIEAEACGTAVIISSAAGLQETTRPGISSIVVPAPRGTVIAEKIAWLFDHPDERLKMGRQGRAFVESRFEIDACFSNIEAKYYEIMKMRRGSM